MAIKRFGLVGVVVLLGILVYGTVALAMGIGMVSHSTHATGSTNSGAKGAAEIATRAPAAVMDDSQGATAGSSGAGVASSSLAYPFPGNGPFQPGPPPNFNGGLSGDGLSAWGVAFKQTTDTNAQVDAALIKSAYQDAQKRAQELASATGVGLGKLVAISDYTNSQPYFGKPCFQPGVGIGGPVQGKPVAPPNGSSGSGGSSSGSSGSAIIQPAPAPVPAPCNQERYLVAWVTIRYALA